MDFDDFVGFQLIDFDGFALLSMDFNGFERILMDLNCFYSSVGFRRFLWI